MDIDPAHQDLSDLFISLVGQKLSLHTDMLALHDWSHQGMGYFPGQLDGCQTHSQLQSLGWIGIWSGTEEKASGEI